ncbi:MAG: AsmA family protein, partial [Gammaproteobacteria bacterium]
MLRWLAALSGIVLTGLVAVVLYLLLVDLGHLRDRFTVLISDSLGREVRIDGPLSLRLGRLARVHAQGVTVANAAWADEPLLFEADSLTAEVALWSILRGPVRIERLALSGAVLRLQEAADGRRNWTGRQPDQPPGAAATPAITS